MPVHENPFRYNKMMPAVANSQRYIAHFFLTLFSVVRVRVPIVILRAGSLKYLKVTQGPESEQA